MGHPSAHPTPEPTRYKYRTVPDPLNNRAGLSQGPSLPNGDTHQSTPHYTQPGGNSSTHPDHTLIVIDYPKHPPIPKGLINPPHLLPIPVQRLEWIGQRVGWVGGCTY